MVELEIIKWGFTGLLAALLWFVRNEYMRQQKEITALKVQIDHIKENYLHRDDFKEFKEELRIMFQEIKTDIKELKN